jgi:hypothetical protein
LRALRDALAAVCATIVGGEPIARGPTFNADVAALVRALVSAVPEESAETNLASVVPSSDFDGIDHVQIAGPVGCETEGRRSKKCVERRGRFAST